MNYESITTCDVCNGKGLGVVLWVSGCDVQCKGCHNMETWDANSGNEFTNETLSLLIEELKRDGIERLTLTGGHPLMPCNRQQVKEIIEHVREVTPNIKIWLYTGYYYNRDMDKECKNICKMCDVVVDGPYVESLKNGKLKFRGSSNQRIIKVKR